MKRDKLGRQGGRGSQEQARMEIMKGDKWRETRRQRQPRAEWRSWKETNEGRQGGSGSQEQPRMERDHEERQMKGDKAAAASRPFGDFGDQQPSHWEVRTPMASSYLGKNNSAYFGSITVFVFCFGSSFLLCFLPFLWHEFGLLYIVCAYVVSKLGHVWVQIATVLNFRPAAPQAPLRICSEHPSHGFHNFLLEFCNWKVESTLSSPRLGRCWHFIRWSS